ncbi:MAG: hypothetical protein ACD_39C00193G0001, partial [uncultured bacterium]
GTRDLPEIETFLVPTYEKTGPYGAKSVSEISINGALPAIGNAIKNAVGVRLTQPPYTAEKVLKAIKELKSGKVASTVKPVAKTPVKAEKPVANKSAKAGKVSKPVAKAVPAKQLKSGKVTKPAAKPAAAPKKAAKPVKTAKPAPAKKTAKKK